MIREATLEDLPFLADLGRQMHKHTRSAPYRSEHAQEFVGGLIESPEALVLVGPSSMLAGMLVPAWICKDWLIAVELFWYGTDGHGLDLLRAFERWASENRCREVRMTTQTKDPRAEIILRRKGYEVSETSHSRMI